MRNLVQYDENQGASAQAVGLTDIEKVAENKARQQVMEAEDRAKRQTNLIIFRLPSSKARTEAQRESDDKIKVDEIMQEIDNKWQPIEVRRLKGKPNSRNSKTDKPLVVSFASERARDETLKAFNTARRQTVQDENGEDTRLCNFVAVRKDLTKKEREAEDKLYKELKQKRSEATESGDDPLLWIRRRGKVVRKEPQGVSSQEVEEDE